MYRIFNLWVSLEGGICIARDGLNVVVGDTKGVKKKPDPMAYDQIIKPQFKNIKPSEILMIGDTSADSYNSEKNMHLRHGERICNSLLPMKIS